MSSSLALTELSIATDLIRDDDVVGVESWLGRHPQAGRESLGHTQTTLLMLAARMGRANCVALLLPQSNALAVDDEGEDALMKASENGHAACVKLLLPHSNPLAVSSNGTDALMRAAHSGHQACVDLLHEVSDPKRQDVDGFTALLLAVEGRHVDSVRRLIARSDLEAQNMYGFTALLVAAHCGDSQSVEALLPHANIIAVGNEGQDAFGLARDRLELDASKPVVSKEQSMAWACLDLLGSTIGPDRLEAFIAQSPSAEMVRSRAWLEHTRLRQHLLAPPNLAPGASLDADSPAAQSKKTTPSRVLDSKRRRL